MRNGVGSARQISEFTIMESNYAIIDENSQRETQRTKVEY